MRLHVEPLEERCVPTMIVGVPTTDLNGVKYYPVVSDYQGAQPTTLRILDPTNPAPGEPHRFLYLLPVEAGVTNQNSQWGDGLEEARSLDLQDRYNATLVAPSFNITPWYADHPTDPSRRLESFMVNDLVPWVNNLAAPGTTPQSWLVGFSKSGFGALGLIFRHPDVFSAVAAWDTPAQLSDVNTYSGTLPILYTGMVDNYGTQENFDTYRIPPLVANQNGPFKASNRIWISGDICRFTADMQQLDQQMTAAGVVHTFVGGVTRDHHWSSGWLEGAVQNLASNATPPQRTFAAPPAVSSDVALLTMAQLQSVIPAAIREWQAAGANPSQIQALENAQFAIADLPPTYLGWTFAPEAGAQVHSGLVVLDRRAQGFGWLIDVGTAGTAGFTVQLAPTEFHATPASPASGRLDLLTVVAHELGHVVGLPDILDESNHPGDLMDQTLNPGVRRLPAAELLVNTAPVAPAPATDGLGNGAVSAPALAGTFSVATPASHQENAPSAAPILFEQWWQAGIFSANPASWGAFAALPKVPASLYEAPALLPPPDRVAALLTGQLHSALPGQAETRRTAAEPASLLFAMAELRPALDEWGNELCNCLNAG